MTGYFLIICLIGIFVWLYLMKIKFSKVQKIKKEQLQKLLICFEQASFIKDNLNIINSKKNLISEIERQLDSINEKIEKSGQLEKLLLELEELLISKDEKTEQLRNVLKNNKLFQNEIEYLLKKENYNEIRAILKTIINNKNQVINDIEKQIECRNMEKSVHFMENVSEARKLSTLKDEMIKQLSNLLADEKIFSRDAEYFVKKENYNETMAILKTIINHRNQDIMEIEKQKEKCEKELTDLVRKLCLLRNMANKPRHTKSIWSTMKDDHFEKKSLWYDPTKYDH